MNTFVDFEITTVCSAREATYCVEQMSFCRRSVFFGYVSHKVPHSTNSPGLDFLPFDFHDFSLWHRRRVTLLHTRTRSFN